MSFAQGAPTQPLVLQGSNVFLYGSSTAGNAFTVQQLSAGNVASFVTSTGATGLIVNPSGLVGIGKTNPAYALDVTGDLNFTGTFRQNGTPYIGSQWTGTTSLYFVGNVGINTTSVANPLTVGGTAVITTLNLTNALGTTYGGTGLTSFTSGGLLYASSTSALASSAAYTAGQVLYGGGAGTAPGSSSGLFWDSGNSRLGIGTATPYSYCHIYSANSGNPLTSGTNSDPSTILRVHCSTCGLDFGYLNAGGAWIQNRQVTASFGTTFPINLNPNGGGVAIGTPLSATSYTLQVAGSVGASSSFTRITGSTGVAFAAPGTGLASTDYNLILTGANDTANRLVVFVNGSARTADGGVSNVTIRNDAGSLILGRAEYPTIVYGNVGIGTASPGALFQVNAAVINPTIPTVHIGDNSNDYGATYGMVHLTRNATPGDTKAHLSIIRNGNTGVNFGFWNNTNTFGIWQNLGNTGTTPTISITAGGNVGIGTASPSYKLHVSAGDSSYSYFGPNTTYSAYLKVGSGSSYASTGVASISCSNGNLHIDAASTSTYAIYLNFFNSGGNGANYGQTNSYGTFYNNGAGLFTGDVTAFYSDERLKTKTGEIENALDKVCSLDTFTYVPNELAKSIGYTDEKERLGLSAQQVQKVAPQVVCPAPIDIHESGPHKGKSKSGEDYLTVQYDKLVPLLVEALKEERSERLRLQDRLERLERLLSQDRTQ